MTTKIYPFTPIKLISAKKSAPTLLVSLAAALATLFAARRLEWKKILPRRKQ
jgi:hypothetical protein